MEKAKCWHTPLPCPLESILTQEVFPYLPAAAAAYLLTTNVTFSTLDTTLFLSAASQLGVGDLIQFSLEGYPEVGLPPQVDLWRRDQNIRMFIEVYCLGNIDVSVLKVDLDRAWGVDFELTELASFIRCFMDPVYLRGEHWQRYLALLPKAEATYKLGLRDQPSDFIRWKMGVPVHLDAKHVLDRLISDAYYTERHLKMESGDNGFALSKAQTDRIKMERDTIFKGLDHRRKLIELERNGDSEDTFDGEEFISRLEMKYDNEEETPIRSMADLEHDESELRTAEDLKNGG